VSVSLTPDLEQFILQKVESSMYPSADDVLREALRLLDDRDRLRAVKLEELREEIAVGLEQSERGEVAPLDMDIIRAKVADRLKTDRADA
jgi:antitoxin ParD1/3/4